MRIRQLVADEATVVAGVSINQFVCTAVAESFGELPGATSVY